MDPAPAPDSSGEDRPTPQGPARAAVIPRREDQHPDDGRHRFDRALYRRRGVVEQCVCWLKECRRLGTRFEKLAVNFLAMIHLAFIERYLRVAFSDRT
ncbi:MAG: hypothetical protein E6K81_12760 [Candidatus Eisenbacteria bacterium]|uniref:Uncharacterized protein n=1 Tax=Eiseniibacteriota bacterium TaxID=2212470 RepID=A0A538U3C0_UNCEI|nr:MAG: hypothetical protein E6K81_12760 [Candidatus Eisenbacteria bacterium]